MAINKTGPAEIQVHERDSDSFIDKIELCILGTDDADADPKTNNGNVSGWQTITPVATLTQAIVDAAITTFRASVLDNGNTVDEEIDAIIGRKQASGDIDADIANVTAGQVVTTRPSPVTYSALV